MTHRARLFFIITFAVTLAFLEAASVIYLSELFPQNGFTLPLQSIPNTLLRVELFREASVITILVSVAALAGNTFWEHFGWFLTIFGVTDIFYYIWLKATTGWPDSLFAWDVLFLIPVPWVAPVIAPLLISLFMIVIGLLITIIHSRGFGFRPTTIAWVAVLLGTGAILYSFWGHAVDTLNETIPSTYPYWLLILGLALYLTGFWHTLQANMKHQVR